MPSQNIQNCIQPQQQGAIYPASYCQMPVCQNPSQVQATQPGTKGGNVGAVNITINGVNPPGAQAPPMYYPAYMPCYHPNYVPYRQEQNLGAQSMKREENTQNLNAAPLEAKPADKKPEEKPQDKAPKAIISLTDEYIKNLEQDLKSDDKDIRGKAAVEIVKRFKEDETRKNEPRLTNLLNLALDDVSKPIVLTAMQALEQGYAQGNPVTAQRLTKIRDEKDEFGNSDTAQGILTKLVPPNQEVKL